MVTGTTVHTKPLAEYVAEELNADLCEIEAKVPYTDDEGRRFAIGTTKEETIEWVGSLNIK